MRTTRRSKVATLEAALEPIRSGSTIGIGGLWYHNTPSAAVRALIRAGVKDLTLYTAPPSSYTTDLLVGAGAVRRGYLPHVSFEHMGLAPNVRKAVEHGRLDLIESDESTILGGLMATLEGLPAHTIGSLRGTDHLKTSPLAVPDPGLGDGFIATPAIVLDTVIIHAQEADEFGNVRCLVTPFADVLLAKAARRVVVTVDRLVPNDAIRAAPKMTTIPGYLVDAIVPLPYGAHPGSSHGHYIHDEHHLRRYLDTCRDTALGVETYLNEYVLGPRSHEEYLERVGGAGYLAQLDEAAL